MKKPKTFTPNELKALWFHYGDAQTAASKMKIGTATLINQANQDIQGREYKMSEDVRSKIEKTYNRLSDTTRKKIKKQTRILDSLDEHTNVKRAIVNTKREREKIFRDYDKYSKHTRSEKFVWYGVMNRLYRRNPNWRIGQWK